MSAPAGTPFYVPGAQAPGQALDLLRVLERPRRGAQLRELLRRRQVGERVLAALAVAGQLVQERPGEGVNAETYQGAVSACSRDTPTVAAANSSRRRA